MKRIDKIRIAFTVLIIVLCLIPFVGMLFSETESAANEVLAQKPQFVSEDGTVNIEFTNELTEYVADNFAFRQELVTANAVLYSKILRTSSNDEVIYGRDGWLYFKKTIDSYTGRNALSERHIFAAARMLSLIDESVTEQGGEFLFAVAPNKNSIYPEYMPNSFEKCEKSDVFVLFEALADEAVPYINLFEVFEETDKAHYFKTDTHWSNEGAALAADSILSALSMHGRYYSSELFEDTEPHKGDLYEMLFPAGSFSEEETKYSQFDFEYTKPFNSADDITIMTQSENNGALMMYRDSFGRVLYPYLAQSFGSAKFLRSTEYRPYDMAAVGADTVIIEIVERNIKDLCTKAPVLAAPERSVSDITEIDIPIEVTVSDENMPDDMLMITGDVKSMNPDTNSAIYIIIGEDVFEAVPLITDDSEYEFCAFIQKACYSRENLSIGCVSSGKPVQSGNVVYGQNGG